MAFKRSAVRSRLSPPQNGLKHCISSRFVLPVNILVKLNIETVSDTDTETSFVDEDTAFHIHKVLHGLKEPYKEVFSITCVRRIILSKNWSGI